MDMSSSPIAGSSRSSSPNPSPTRTDVDLPNDVDESFNSSMSLSDSPYMSPSNGRSFRAAPPALVFTAPGATAAAAGSALPQRPDPVPIQRAKAFGRERSMNANMGATSASGMMLPPPVPMKRSGLPGQWTMDAVLQGGQETSPRSDHMDLDSPASSRKNSLAGSLSGSFSGSPGLGSFFCESPNPPAQPTGKRRSLVTDSPASPTGSPTAKRTSLGGARDKAISSGVMLFGSSMTRNNSIAGRRPALQKRPALAAVPGSMNGLDSRSPSFASADAVLYPSKPTGSSLNAFPRAAPAPMRRAYSVCDQPSMPDLSEDESEYENSPSAAALHVKQVNMARKAGRSRLGVGLGTDAIDGSPGYKPARSSIAVPSASPSKLRAGTAGMPGFGDNEMDGKILPCHKVKVDGLVRITPDTLGDLLQGKYSSQITRYHIIDCRFDYEYAGGHVDGAVNLKSVEALDDLLLTESRGLYGQGNNLPSPSKGDEPEGKVVLVFHCEFSAKRAPTFAKELRRRDRTLNSSVYPKIYYPELYILEGGYCGFYQSQPDKCEPQGYVRMDDPLHLKSRDSDLHHFRSSNFSRTRSFTYGESQSLTVRGGPACPPMAFAAGSIAQNRRHGTGSTINEEEESSPSGANVSCGSGSGSGSEMDVDTSPCPRVCSMGPGPQPVFGSAKPRTLGRMGGFGRTASYARAGLQRAPLRL